MTDMTDMTPFANLFLRSLPKKTLGKGVIADMGDMNRAQHEAAT